MNQQIAAVGYTQPTPIQREAIPEVLDGRDVIGLAQTGTGKTAAFALPILEKMSIKDRRTQALVLCPTRELAMQTAQVIRMLSSHMRGLRTIAVYGGQPIQRQIQALKGGAQVVVGTPGRLKDLIRRHVLKLQQVRCTVMDEADEMLDMGFREDMQEILDAVEGPHQTILFGDHAQGNSGYRKVLSKQSAYDKDSDAAVGSADQSAISTNAGSPQSAGGPRFAGSAPSEVGPRVLQHAAQSAGCGG